MHLLLLQILDIRILFSITSHRDFFFLYSFCPSLFAHPGGLELSSPFQVWACFCHLDLLLCCGSSQVSIKVCVESDCCTSPSLCQVCQQQPLSPPGSHCYVTPGRGQCANRGGKTKQKTLHQVRCIRTRHSPNRFGSSRHGVI